MNKIRLFVLALLLFCTNIALAQTVFTDGFESGNTDQSTTIANWTNTAVGSYSWTANSSLTTYNRTPRTGSWNAYLHYSGEAWLFRQVTLTGGTTYFLSAYARQDGTTTSNAYLELKYGTAATIVGMTTAISSQVGLDATYKLVSGTFTPATSGTYYVGVHGYINSSPWYLSLDDVLLKVAQSPNAPPINFSVTSVSSTGFTLNWVDNSTDETAFRVYRSTDNVNFTQVGSDITSTTTAGTGTSYNLAQTGLAPSATYYYRIAAVLESETSYLTGSGTTNAPGNIVSTASGNWSATGTWVGGVVPTSGDNVTIADGHTVVIDAAANCNGLTVGQGTSGILRFGTSATSLTVQQGVSVSAGATFEAGASGGSSLTHTLNIGGNSASSTGSGNLTVNGTFDMYIGSSNGKASVYFYGANNSTVSGSGTTMDFYYVYLNKGTTTATSTVTPPILEFQRGFTVNGANTVGLIYTHTAGVLKIGGTFTLSTPLYNSASYTIPSLGGVWLNNSNFTAAGQTGSPTNNGLLKVSAGTYNIGTGTGNSMGGSATSVFVIEGGAVNVSGRFYISSSGVYYNQSGGTVTVQTVGNSSSSSPGFGITSSTSTTFIMSGGTIITQLASTGSTQYDYYVNAATINITGGTLQLGNASSGTAKTYKILGSTPNLVISNASANHNLTLAGSTTVYGDFTINGTGTFSPSTLYTLTMKGQSISNPGNITNNGTMTLNAGSTQALSFASSFGNQTLTNNGTITGSALPSLTINNTYSGGTVTLPANLTVKGDGTVSSSLTLTAGTLTASNLTLGAGGTGSVGFTTYVADGLMTNVPTYSIGTNGTANINYNGSTARQTGNELPASINGTLTINNAAGITLNSPCSVGTLTLTNGELISSATNFITVTGGLTTSIARTNGYVNGPLAFTLKASQATGSTFLFPLGKTSSTYRPLELVNPITGAGGTAVIKAEVFDANSGGTAGVNMQSIRTDRYWKTEFVSGQANFTNTAIRLTETGLDANSGIGKSATQTGAYDFINVTGTPGSTVQSGTITDLGYLAIGVKSLAMSYTSSTATQTVTANIIAGNTDQQILGIQVVATGNASPINATSFIFNTGGGTTPTTNPADISNAKLWSTGTSSTFATTSQYGSTINTPSGSFEFTGSQTLTEGTNYFWLTYDIASGATDNDIVDAVFTQVTAGGTSTPAPTVSDPAGSRTLKAPLTGTVQVGTSQTITSLTGSGGLFEKINNSALSGNLTVNITSDITETGANKLSQWTELGTGNYTITIQPASATAMTLSGATSANTTPLIGFDGADRVTIDGSFSGDGNKWLTFINSNSTAGSTGPVIQFNNGASNNTVRYCNVQSNGTTSTIGAVFFGATGINSNNAIVNNSIRDLSASTGNPYYAIYAGAAGDSVLTITNNEIFNWTNGGIYLTSVGGGSTISNNKLYQTATRTTALYPIYVNSTVGGGFTISGNSIGGSTVTRSGTAMTSINGNMIQLAGLSNGPVSTISSNTISNINMTSTSAGNNWIYVTAGNTVISGNTIGGKAAVYDTLMFGYDTRMIYSTSSSTVEISNNTIGNIRNPNAANTYIYGIQVTGGVNTITGNTIHDIYSTSNSYSLGNCFTGINVTSSLNGQTVSQNTIYGLYQINATPSGSGAYSTIGIYYSGSGTGATVAKNKIYNFTFASTGTGTYAPAGYGIYVASTSTGSYYNNMISLGSEQSALQTKLYGIYDAGTSTANNYYYNSIYIGGAITATGVASNSYGFARGSSATINVKNNILYNNRLTSGTGVNLAVANLHTAATGWTSNNNVYNASVTSKIGQWLSTGSAVDFTAWKSASTQDASSLANIPVVFADTSVANLHMNMGTTNTPIESGGATITGITTDFDGQVRPGPAGSVNGGALSPDIGADEFDGVPAQQMVFVSSNTTQSNRSVVFAGTSNNQVIGIEVVMSNTFNPLNLSQLKFKTLNTSDADVTEAKVFYTGNSSSFGTSTQYGTTVTNPTGEFTVDGTQALSEGTNYFWLTYTISSSALSSHTIDAECQELTVDGMPYTPDITSPDGTREILGSLSGTYHVNIASPNPFGSITQAFNTINQLGITGPVTVLLDDASYSSATETFPITMGIVTGASATNTVTIKPNTGVTTTITGSGNAIFKLDGSDYITIDGSNNGTTTRNLKLINSSTSAASGVWIASKGTGAGATYNTVKNCVIIGGSNSTATVYGVFLGGSAVGAENTGDDNDNCSVINDSIAKVYTGVFSYAGSTGVNDNLLIKDNSIGSTTTADRVGIYGMNIVQANNAQITGNTISEIYSTGTTIPVGLLIGTGVTNTKINRNKISNIQYSGSSGYGARGLDVNTGSTTANITISNNVITGILADGDESDHNWVPLGIRIAPTQGGMNIYYNSINLSGTPGSGTYASFSAALYIGSAVTNVYARNNSLANSIYKSSSSNSSYAMYSGSANTAYVCLNNNIYYGSGTQGKVGYLSSAISDSASWKTATGHDTSSYFSNPAFTSATNLQPQLGSLMLANAAPIAMETEDYTQFTRSITAPSIGAYENGVDLTGPTINYTALGGTTSTANRSLTNVTITDASGVNNTAGLKPRLYFKKSTNASAFGGANNSTFNGWKYVEANGSTSPYDFTIDYSLLYSNGAISNNETVQYFVVAQDLASTPNISSNPSTGFAGSTVANVTSAPTTPNSYSILNSLSGSVTVGTSGNYTTLTGTGGLFETLNNSVLTGNITATIISDLTEDGTTALNAWSEEGAGNYTVTIQGESSTPHLISGTKTSGGLIRLNGADRVTIDGKSTLTITNLGTSSSATIQLISLGAGLGATNNTIKNCILTTGTRWNASTYGISIGGSTVGTAGADNNTNTVQNNTIQKSYYGIYAVGISTGVQDGLTISGNTIGHASDTSKAFAVYGLYVGYQQNLTITQNTIEGSWGSFGAYGSYMYGIYGTSTIQNAVISRNKIANIKFTGTNGYSGVGINLSAGNTSCNVLIANNLFSGLLGDGYTGLTNGGTVAISLGSGTGYRLYYNSINLSGSNNYAGITVSSGLYLASGVTGINMKNNIIKNTLYNANTSYSCTGYGIYSANTTLPFDTLDFNDYYIVSAGTGTNKIGYFNSTAYADSAAWLAITAKESHSRFTDPVFASASDLRIDIQSPMIGIGTPLWAVTDDYSGTTRSLTAPSIGAYENGVDVSGPTITYSSVLQNTTSTGNRTFTAVIIDGTGVNTTAGTKPRAYFKKSGDNATFGGNTSTDNGWKWTEATNTGSTFTFTIDNSILYSVSGPGTVSMGDIIQYFIVAQDVSPSAYVSSLPSTGFAGTSVAAITSAPTSPYTYKVVGAPLHGSYTVGTAHFNKVTGKNITFEKRTRKVVRYEMKPEPMKFAEENGNATSKSKAKISDTENASELSKANRPVLTAQQVEVEQEYYVPMLKDAEYTDQLGITAKEAGTSLPKGIEGVYSTIGAALSDLNERGVDGATTFLLSDASYTTETLPLTIKIMSSNMPTSTNTVTIKPNTSVTATISGLADASSVIKIDGADYITIDGSNNGTTSRDLTISNTSTTTNSGGVWIASASVTDSANYVTVKNCKVSGNAALTTLVGITVAGTATTTTYPSSAPCNITLQNNEISKSQYGILLLGNNSASKMGKNNTVTLNNVGVTGTGNEIGVGGILADYQDGAAITNNIVQNVISAASADLFGIEMDNSINGSISKNKVFNISYTGASTSKTNGIDLYGAAFNTSAAPSANTVDNNMVYAITSSNTSSYYNVVGIQGECGYGDKFYNNTVYLEGNLGASASWSACFANGNSLSSTRDSAMTVKNNIFVMNGTSSYATKLYAIYAYSASLAPSTLDYNNYYSTGSGSATARLGYFNSADVASLATWKTNTGKDSHSSSVAVNFVSSTDLHLTGSSDGDANLGGVAITGHTTDIDGDTRNADFPYKGADEVISANLLGVKVNLTAFLQGYTAADGSAMATPISSEDVTVTLCNTASPYAEKSLGIGNLGTNGSGLFRVNTASVQNGQSYYLKVTHRNSLETWSSAPVTISSGAVTYDFTTAANKAYGNNLKQVGSKWCIYSGDINQDGTIGFSDLVSLDNAAYNFAQSTPVFSAQNDLNGDLKNDYGDFIIWSQNADNYVKKAVPTAKAAEQITPSAEPAKKHNNDEIKD